MGLRRISGQRQGESLHPPCRSDISERRRGRKEVCEEELPSQQIWEESSARLMGRPQASVTCDRGPTACRRGLGSCLLQALTLAGSSLGETWSLRKCHGESRRVATEVFSQLPPKGQRPLGLISTPPLQGSLFIKIIRNYIHRQQDTWQTPAGVPLSCL